MVVYASAVYATYTVRQTRLGMINGTLEDVHGAMVAVFLGIPYAKPPIGDERHLPPLLVDSLEPQMDDEVFFEEEEVEGNSTLNETFVAVNKRLVYDATGYRSACLQKANEWLESDVPVSEDCLYLNVFAAEPEVSGGVSGGVNGMGGWREDGKREFKTKQKRREVSGGGNRIVHIEK